MVALAPRPCTQPMALLLAGASILSVQWHLAARNQNMSLSDNHSEAAVETLVTRVGNLLETYQPESRF